MRRLFLLLPPLVTGCAGRSPAAEVPEAHEDRMIAELNAAARRGAVVERLHDTVVEDPYRALEVDDAGTRRWIDAQTERTERALASASTPAMRERLATLLSIGTLGGASLGGGRLFYEKREGEREQSALFVRDAPSATPRLLLDPERLGPRVALDYYLPSPGGRLLLYGISQDGDERSTLHVLDVATGAALPDRIERAKWSNLAWLHDERGFYYTRYPAPGEPGYDAEAPETYFPRVYFHTLGTDPESDPLVFASPEPTDFPAVHVSDDDRFVTLTVFRGWSESDVLLLDRGADPRRRVVAPSAERPLRPVIAGAPHLTSGGVHQGRLLMQTNLGAPRHRLVVTDAEAPAAPAHWRELVPETAAPIEHWAIIGGRLAVHYDDDLRSRVRLFDLDGLPNGEVPLPGRGEIDGLAGEPDRPTLVFAWSGPLDAPALFAFDVATAALATIDRVEADLDLSDFEVTVHQVASADGTEVPVQLVHRRGLVRDGSHPTLVYGYGGFSVSLLPSFARNVVYWLERGGVYAIANVRGGGERGEAWHRAGNLENKERVFEDFEAVLRWLASSGISRPERIAITGGSNGGLLMGAMITRCPDAFTAAASYVGLYDMVRYHRFPPAELWISEYGSPEDAAAFGYLHAYSPYHRIREGVAYPAVLIETADHDTRVYWGHSTKMAARLQEATSSDRPIYFYMERQVGHGAGTRRTDLVARYVRMFAFLESALGMAPAAPAPGVAATEGRR